MRKKKIKEKLNDLPIISNRKKTITGILPSSGIEIKISVENPEDWVKLSDYYIRKIINNKNLSKDLFWFLEVGHYHASQKTKQHKGQSKIDTLKIQAAILYGFLDYIRTNQYPNSLSDINLRLLQKVKEFDAVQVAAYFMDSFYQDYFKYKRFGSGAIDESKFYKVSIKRFYDGKDCNNFFKKYIKAGLQMINDKDTKNLRELLENNFLMLTGLSFIPNREIYYFLYTISIATYYQLIDPESGSIKTYTDKDGILKPKIEEAYFKEIKSIRHILKQIFPNLPFPNPD